MKKKNLEGQIDLFSLIDNSMDEDSLPLLTDLSLEEFIEEKIEVREPEVTELNHSQEKEELDLSEGDIIWAVVDKKVESHVIIKAQRDHCITRSEDGQIRRLTIRSKGICWEYTREKAEELYRANE